MLTNTPVSIVRLSLAFGDWKRPQSAAPPQAEPNAIHPAAQAGCSLRPQKPDILCDLAVIRLYTQILFLKTRTNIIFLIV